MRKAWGDVGGDEVEGAPETMWILSRFSPLMELGFVSCGDPLNCLNRIDSRRSNLTIRLTAVCYVCNVLNKSGQ